MHTAIIVSDENSLAELNDLLAEEQYYVREMSAGSNGTWLVILTDQDPDNPSLSDLADAFDAYNEQAEQEEDHDHDHEHLHHHSGKKNPVKN